jgi:hypothetical protein
MIMRNMAGFGRRLAAAAVAAVTVVAVAACDGGGGTASATSKAAQPTPPAAATSATLPTQPVCDVFPKSTVSRLIGVPVFSFDDKDLLAGEQPTTCFYHTSDEHAGNADEVEIHWMLIKDALWSDQINSIGTVDSGGIKTVTVRYPGLGDDAIQTTGTTDVAVTKTYMVLLNNRGLVLELNNASTRSVTDAAFLNFAKEVVDTVNKL